MRSGGVLLMGKKMVNNPSSSDLASMLILADALEKVAKLEADLLIEKAREPRIEKVTVEKEVLRDDPDLLRRYNDAMKELGQVKLKQEPKISSPKVLTPQSVSAVKVIRVEVIKKRYLLLALTIGATAWPLFTLLEKLIASLLE